MTTTTKPNPAGGWGWIGDLPRNERAITKFKQLWDGLFVAACPCGRDTDWDAFTFQPLCHCSVMTQ